MPPAALAASRAPTALQTFGPIRSKKRAATLDG